MNDRELLEMAAKAAGIPLARLEPETIWDTGHITRNGWSSLADDGDAFRLAVALRMSLSWDVYDGCEYAFATGSNNFQGYDCEVLNDPSAATRRAITLVAAEIGRSMP